MNRRNLIKQISRALLGVGATALLPSCASTGVTGGGGGLPPATKDNPFINSLGMKFVPIPGTKILMCTTETTVAQYHASGMGIHSIQSGSNFPMASISLADAKAWCEWLCKKEGRRYRLPRSSEWNAAIGPSTFPWGYTWPPPTNFANYAGQEMRAMGTSERISISGSSPSGAFPLIGSFSDRHKFTAPVGSYQANALGLHDLAGNLWEWCEDGSFRGGSCLSGQSRELYSAFAGRSTDGTGGANYGFRCVLGT